MYVKVSGFNERTAEVRRARGLHLPDRHHDSRPAVSMLILARVPSFGSVRSSLTVTNWLPARPSAGPHLTVPSNNNGQQKRCCLDNGPPDKLGSLYSLLWPRLSLPSCCLAVLGSARTGGGGCAVEPVDKCTSRSDLLYDTCCLSPRQNTQNRLRCVFIETGHNVGPERAF